jgi:predicted amidophosphoribosyltransferase
MRIDLCRKCGHERKKYEQSESCKTCGRDFDQFICLGCRAITEPQFHIHRIEMEALTVSPQAVSKKR